MTEPEELARDALERRRRPVARLISLIEDQRPATVEVRDATLAALQAGSTDGEAIAAELQSVSGGAGDGEKCFTFAEGRALVSTSATMSSVGQ